MPRLEVLIQGWFSLWVLTYSAVALCYYNLVSASHQEQSSIFFSVYNAEYSVLTAHLTLAVSSGDSSNETLTFSPVLFASGLVSFELRVTSQCTQTRSWHWAFTKYLSALPSLRKHSWSTLLFIYQNFLHSDALYLKSAPVVKSCVW